jgi:glutamate synthase domain-containing protein 2
MSERYSSNLWEMVTAFTRINPTAVVENSLRAASGAIIERPFGSPRKFLHFDGLIFSPAQLKTLPTDEDVDINITVTIGPKAKKPLTLSIPLMAAAMGYGIGVSEKVKIAIARGTAAAGTSTNTGEGGFLPEERENAKYLIIQYNTGHWSKTPEILKQADAIEIHIGRGAIAGTATVISSEDLQGRASEIMQVQDQEIIVVPARHREINSAEDLKSLVDKLRDMTGGVPIGVKLCASAILEADLDATIWAGVDFISIDGGQGGTKSGAPILEDDFGLPTIFALTRAVHHLQKRGVKDSISLLSGGGYKTPSECLKALALGADAVYMGTALLWAMTHDQVAKVAPWEPPTQLAYYSGSYADEFNVDDGAKYLENFLESCSEEMKLAIRALGKHALREVNTNDLVAMDEWTGKVTKVRLASRSERLQ